MLLVLAGDGGLCYNEFIVNGVFMAEGDSSTKTKPKSKKGLIFGIVGGVLALALLVAAFLLLEPGSAPNDPKASPAYTQAFFIYDNNKYTLWNASGERLTEDEYDSKSTFIGGYAYVRKGGEYALISDRGKTTVECGQISEMVDDGGGLYLVKGNDGAYRVLLGDGRVLATGEELGLKTSSSATATFAAVRVGDNYAFYNYAGVLMAQYAGDAEDELYLSGYDDFGYAYCDGFNIVFDNRTGKELASWEGKRYSFEDVSDDRQTILLSEYEDDEDYRLIANGKLYELNEMKYYGMVRNTNIVVGYDDYEQIAFLDKDYKVTKRLGADLAIKDLDNYAVMNDDGEVEVYYRGQLAKKFSEDADLASGVLTYDDFYVIEDAGKTGIYRLDGSLAFGEYKDVKSVYDRNHHVAVSEDGDNYYLIDSNGKRIGEKTFTKIYSYEKSYLVVDADGKRAILAPNGEMVADFIYKEAYHESTPDHEIWSLKLDSGKSDVIDVATGQVVAREVSAGSFYNNYFTVKREDGGYDYLTYAGAVFYSSVAR